MSRTNGRRQAWASGLLALGLLAGACSDDGGGGTRTVTAKDYEFEDLPSSVKAGTKLVLTNASTKEVHELVAMRLADTEKRSADELVKLPEDQLEALFTGPPAMVLAAPPGGVPQIAAVGDGTLAEKGRYLVLCFIPTGADPGAYLKAAQAAGNGPPPQVAGGPPHAAQGMYGQITVR